MENKISLYGFNNLTKTLSFNIYDVCYAKSPREQQDYIAYIDEQYNSERLTNILCDVTEMIGARVLNISKQDYEPQGASVNVLIAEKELNPAGQNGACAPGQEPCDSPHLSGVSPGQCNLYLQGGYRRVHLRHHFAAERPQLSDRQL